MPKFILRVDDVGQAVDQSKPDVGLEYFRRWWDAGGWEGLPVYLGVVAGTLGEREIDVLNVLTSSGRMDCPTKLCSHGWSHRDETLTSEEIFKSSDILPTVYVIPPYNKYDSDTIKAVALLHDESGEQPVLFGGFNGEHHPYGEAPRIVDGVLHLSAERALYQHAYQVAEAIEMGYGTDAWPMVITLHHRWDANFLDGVRRLRDLVADKLTTVDEAFKWAETYGKK